MATEAVTKAKKEKSVKQKKDKKDKKEKKVKKEEAVAAAKPEEEQNKEKKKKKDKKRKAATQDDDARSSKKQAVADGIQYLRTFHSDRSAWKFKKNSQVWCLHHMYDENVMEDADFDIMLAYMKDMKGQARTITLREAQEKIPPAPTDVDQDIFDAEAALNAVPPSAGAVAEQQQEQDGDTPVIKRARAVVKVLADH
ncbi:hypothetical protein BJV82DRAFT_608062 [Fennellomyces sp. T-0311]|nr:hypothetical protein BJV82DRAFT_608062 [Fennellomyces sp. T-0311]